MAKPKRPRPQLGDIYAARLLDGRYGAVRVLRLFPRSLWLMCTQYLGDAPPAIDDPALRKVVRCKRSEFHAGPALTVVDRPLPDDFVLVGNRALTATEKKLDPKGRYGAQWGLVQTVLHEWRWEHDRAAVEREFEARRAEPEPTRAPPGKRKRTPRSTLTEAELWKLIGARAEIATMKRALAKRSQADIREFSELLAHKLYLLDAKAYADHAGAAGRSADAFLYARCAVVGRGRAFYQDVLAHPERFPADADLEDLLTVASAAFLAKTGEELDEDTHYSYETGSNAAGWPG